MKKTNPILTMLDKENARLQRQNERTELLIFAQKTMGLVLMRDSTTTLKQWADKISCVYDVVENKKHEAIYNLLKTLKGTVTKTRTGAIKLNF